MATRMTIYKAALGTTWCWELETYQGGAWSIVSKGTAGSRKAALVAARVAEHKCY